MSIIDNPLRVGNFTSSEIWKLMTKATDRKSFGVPAKTYVRHKNLERKLGRSLNVEKSSRATLWGKFLQKRVHDLIGLGYELIDDITIVHPEISYWCGSPDSKNESEGVVGDIKCFEPLNFCEYVDVLNKAHSEGNISHFKDEYPVEYWQLISNAIILGYDYIEPIVYMPYRSELPDIRLMAYNYDGPDQYKYRFINEADESELPFLPDNGLYKNLNLFRFEAPQKDKEALTETVERAGQLLINQMETVNN